MGREIKKFTTALASVSMEVFGGTYEHMRADALSRAAEFFDCDDMSRLKLGLFEASPNMVGNDNSVINYRATVRVVLNEAKEPEEVEQEEEGSPQPRTGPRLRGIVGGREVRLGRFAPDSFQHDQEDDEYSEVELDDDEDGFDDEV